MNTKGMKEKRHKRQKVKMYTYGRPFDPPKIVEMRVYKGWGK